MARLVSSRGAALLLSRNRIRTKDLNAALLLPTKQARTPYLNTEILHSDPALLPGGLITDARNAEASPDGIELSTSEVTKLVEEAFVGKLDSTYTLRLGDRAYYLPSIEEVTQILTGTQRERRSWIVERYDCDDFAYVLKAFASSVAYHNSGLTFGLCCGIIWGKFEWLDEFHACNWVITSDKIFRLIEPQKDAIYPADACSGSVTFVAA